MYFCTEHIFLLFPHNTAASTCLHEHYTLAVNKKCTDWSAEQRCSKLVKPPLQYIYCTHAKILLKHAGPENSDTYTVDLVIADS